MDTNENARLKTMRMVKMKNYDNLMANCEGDLFNNEDFYAELDNN